MKKFVYDILNDNTINFNDITKFVIEYCELFDKHPNAMELQAIMTLIQTGAFDLKYAVDMYARKKNIPIVRLYNQFGKLISVNIE